jgi:uroporphyrinogen-III synthase
MDELDGSPAGPGFRPDQLEGFRIGVTSDRRSEDLIAAFERRGAEVLHAPTIKMAGVENDGHLERETQAVIESRPDVLLATTSYGLRRWFEAADAAGVGGALLDALSGTRVLVRGPKALGAVRAAGLDDGGMSARETTESLVDMVIAAGTRGKTVAVQLHGATDYAQLSRLTDAGATVLTVRPYLWQQHDDQLRVQRLIAAITAGAVDAVTFTSAPAADALLRAAERERRLDAVLAAFGVASGGLDPAPVPVVAAAVGPVTAEPLLEHGIAAIAPDRFRMGALIKLVCDHLETARVLRLETVAGPVLLRGRVAEIGGARVTLSPVSLALFRRLVGAGGAIVPRDRLALAAPEPLDEHAMDVAISRLRQSLPDPKLVETVIKRGYRLAL